MSDNESVSNESISNESLVSETESQDDSRSASPTESLASVEVEPVTVESLIGELVPAVSEEMATAGIALSPSTVMQVLRIAMEAVEGSPIKGEDQKELAVKIILERRRQQRRRKRRRPRRRRRKQRRRRRKRRRKRRRRKPRRRQRGRRSKRRRRNVGQRGRKGQAAKGDH